VKRIVALVLLFTMSLPALALTGGQVMYAGGTVPGLGMNAIGRLDLASDTWLTFESAGSRLTIPYSAIESFEYSKEVTRHLGVLPAIAIGLVRQRQHRHFFVLHIATRLMGHKSQSSKCPSKCPALFRPC
jgi:hypothetical protein